MRNLPRGYRDAVARIAETLGLESGLNAFSLARFPDVLTVERRELDKDKAAAALSEITAKAVEEFNAMREREGERLRRDMLGKLETIEGLVSVVEERSPQTVKEYRERLEARLRDILADRSLDEQRVITEAAIFADRTAVDEETVRLRSHIAQFRTMLEEGSSDRPEDGLPCAGIQPRIQHHRLQVQRRISRQGRGRSQIRDREDPRAAAERGMRCGYEAH